MLVPEAPSKEKPTVFAIDSPLFPSLDIALALLLPYDVRLHRLLAENSGNAVIGPELSCELEGLRSPRVGRTLF